MLYDTVLLFDLAFIAREEAMPNTTVGKAIAGGRVFIFDSWQS